MTIRIPYLLGVSAACSGLVMLAWAASLPPSAQTRAARPAMARPDAQLVTSAQERPLMPGDDLTEPGAVAWGSAEAEIIDTTTMLPQIHQQGPWTGPIRRTREVLPEHKLDHVTPIGPANDLPVGGLLEETRTQPQEQFPGITQTAWVPPDPTLAVGPSHIVSTVNMTIAFFSKTGTMEFSQLLSNDGSPGFFESVGGGNFTFDPKCFYDHLAGRFVVLALEVYGSTQSWITFAVSDDNNPHGTWYKYRTNAVVTVGSNTYWWDYPGFGYDADAYYVTGNLFGLNNGGWAGVGYRVLEKAEVLDGDPVVYSTLRDGNSASVQVAQCFGSNQAPYFVSVWSSTQLHVQAITNPLTAPALVSTNVTVPGFSGPGNAPAAGGQSVQLIDDRIMNVHWRDGNLYACHNISSGGRNFARWYHMNTNNWPASGSVSLVQSGNVDGGSGIHTYFGAIYSDAFDNVGMVVGSSSSSQRIAVNSTGRTPADPLGTMGALVQEKLAPVNGGGRWGDYYDIAIDPTDDTTFWIIGEYPESFGWSTWISSFQLADNLVPVAVDDVLGTISTPAVETVDVLANDYHTGGLALDIDSFDSASAAGGTVTLSVGTGPGGRDELTYTPPTGYNGPDSFDYTIRDPGGQTASATVSADLIDPTTFRDPDSPVNTRAGVGVRFYALNNPTQLPDFDALSPYKTTEADNINVASTSGNYPGADRADNLGALYEGFVDVPADGVYTLYVESDDGSRLYVGDTLVVDNDGLHSMQERSGTIGLKTGRHAVRVEFFEATGGAGCIARIEGGGLTKQVIPAGRWSQLGCLADLDYDFDVDLGDLSKLLANFGRTGGAERDEGDMDGNGTVDLADLSIFLVEYGRTCDF